ncbi:unnamed protein product [Brassica oleracea var. botrytis]
MPHSKSCHFNHKIQELNLGEEISRKISNLLLNNSSYSSMTSEKALQIQMKRILMSLLMIKNYNLKY